MDRIAKLKEFLEANPDDSFVRHALALEHIKAGDDEKALSLFRELLQRDENYIGSYYHISKLLEKMNRPEEAKSWYEKGILLAQKAGDTHARNELQSAYDDLLFNL